MLPNFRDNSNAGSSRFQHLKATESRKRLKRQSKRRKRQKPFRSILSRARSSTQSPTSKKQSSMACPKNSRDGMRSKFSSVTTKSLKCSKSKKVFSTTSKQTSRLPKKSLTTMRKASSRTNVTSTSQKF